MSKRNNLIKYNKQRNSLDYGELFFVYVHYKYTSREEVIEWQPAMLLFKLVEKIFKNPY